MTNYNKKNSKLNTKNIYNIQPTAYNKTSTGCSNKNANIIRVDCIFT